MIHICLFHIFLWYWSLAQPFVDVRFMVPVVAMNEEPTCLFASPQQEPWNWFVLLHFFGVVDIDGYHYNNNKGKHSNRNYPGVIIFNPHPFVDGHPLILLDDEDQVTTILAKPHVYECATLAEGQNSLEFFICFSRGNNQRVVFHFHKILLTRRVDSLFRFW